MAPDDPRITGRLAHAVARVARVRGLGRRARALAIAVTSRILVANAVAALFVVVYLTLTEDQDPGESWAGTIVANALVYAAVVTVFGVAAIVRGRRLFAVDWEWLDGDRPATEEQRRALLRQPERIGLFPLRYWALAAVVAPLVGSLYDGDADVGPTVLAAVAILQGGLVAALLGFFLGERALRPVFALVFREVAPDPRRSVGVSGRLVLAWALGSGVPLVGIVVTPFVVTDSELDTQWAMGWLAVVALLGGLLITLVAARSITGPIGQVRTALRAVGTGDLDTAVVVDDPGELGQLQAGVNEMVAGLRERARLEDLFGRHVGPSVVQQALREGVRLGGELRCVTVLFVDLRGSTELARRLPPQDVVALLNRFFAAVVAACDAEGGRLDSYAGDGALCVFGAPDDGPDHATRGLRASRRLAAALAELRATLPDLDAGIGVATGDVVAGHVGTESRLEYTVIGTPANTAARLTAAAKERPGRALADRHTVEAANPAERACWEPSRPVDLPGLEPGLPVWEPAAVR